MLRHLFLFYSGIVSEENFLLYFNLNITKCGYCEYNLKGFYLRAKRFT
jgi:hypothetical protein